MDVTGVKTRNECALHGAEGREPWGRAFRGIEVVRCDHLGSAYVVEMILLAGNDEQPQYSRHIHFVRDRQREVHVLAESLSQDAIDAVWEQAIYAMESGVQPRGDVAKFHDAR